MFKPLTLCSLVVFVSVGTGCGKDDEGVISRQGEPDFVEKFDDDRMDAAISEAESTLDTFVAALKASSEGTDGFAVKKGFTYGTDGKEFIWVGDVSFDGSGFIGTINNEPVNPVGVKLGQKVTIARDAVVDWMFMSNGKLQGGYTIVALIYGTPDQAQYEKQMKIDWSKYKFLGK